MGAAIHARRSDATTATFYVHADHLGSPELITNSSGAQVIKLSFGAYGERRDSDWDGAVSSGDMTTIGNTIRHGFTGHEHLDSVSLIHMNGRVYDPIVARFLGVDPIVESGISQSPNSYSYVWNNPLKYTDPSGYGVWRWPPKRVDGGGGSSSGGMFGGRSLGAGAPGVLGPHAERRESRQSQPRSLDTVPDNGDLMTSTPMDLQIEAGITVVAAADNQTGKPVWQCTRFLMLPQNDTEGGFYNYGTPANGRGQYGLAETLQVILDVGAMWASEGRPAFGVGNMSLEFGGPFPFHKGHTRGDSFDVRPVRSDGGRVPETTWWSGAYDRRATQRLVDLIRSTTRVRSVLFNDPNISGVQPWSGHDDHLHVKVRTSCID